MPIREVLADHCSIPLPVVLSDSTHGSIRGFELVTVRVRDAEGVEGVGYTYTVGAGGAAVHALVARDLAPWLAGRDADRIEARWQAMWWDLRARRQGAPLWRMLGGFDPRVPCYAGGIDLDVPLDALLRQTDDNLPRGFRAVKMKVGRPSLREDVERVRAMRAHLGSEFPLMVDANMRWSGHTLVVHDLRAEAATPHIAAGAVWANTPQEVAGASEGVFTSLPGPPEVEAVALGEPGLLAGRRSEQAYSDLSTNSPTVVRRIHAAFAGRGIPVLDAPVSGGPRGARTRKLAIWVGSDEAVFRSCCSRRSGRACRCALPRRPIRTVLERDPPATGQEVGGTARSATGVRGGSERWAAVSGPPAS